MSATRANGAGQFPAPSAERFLQFLALDLASDRHPAFAGNVFAAPFVTGATIGQQGDGQPQQQKQNYLSHGTKLIGIVSDASLCH